MRVPRRLRISPFLAVLLLVPVLATLVPARGGAAAVLDRGTVAAICLLFFLHGARLAPSQARAGLTRWRFQLLVLGCSFLLFPVLGLAVGLLPHGLLSPELATGFLFLTLLPSTVQTSIAYTSIARGDVALAVSAASLSNVLGVVITPLLAAALLGSQVHITAASVLSIVGELLVPFALGQALHRFLGEWLASHRRLVSLVDQASVLLVVYAAFSTGVTQGLWTTVPPVQLLTVVALSLLLLGVVLALVAGLGRALRLPRRERIVLLFCGSKKSQASGLPMAFLLFPAHLVGLFSLPLMIFHLLQLLVCAAIAERLARTAPEAGDAGPGGGLNGAGRTASSP